MTRVPFRRLGAVTAVSAAVLWGAGAVPGTAGASPSGASAVRVDCQAPPGGNGSPERPLNSLVEASAAHLVPGQRLLFHRGSVCTGTLTLHSSGAPGAPIVVGTYGGGPLPQIRGNAADAVVLDNVSHVVVRRLDISNVGATAARRRGVHVVADGTTVQDVTLLDLYVHDVDGDLAKDSGGSAGIQLDALGTSPAGRFDGVTVSHDRIDNVSRSGIFIAGTQAGGRPPASQYWAAGSTGVVVADNSLSHLAGDGIVSTGTVGTLIEGNTVVDGNRAGTPFTSADPICDAGIWAFDANSTVIRGNDVSGMEFNGCDGTGYDVDYDQDGTVVEDNYSHDNAGGFILLCTDPALRTATVRYNLSVDDGASISESPCDISSGSVGTLDGVSFTNNTIVAPAPHAALQLTPIQALFAPGTFLFADNVVAATTPQTSALPCGTQCSNNLSSGLPTSGTDAVARDPRFVDPGRPGTGRRTAGRGYKVRRSSPAVGAGLAIPGGATSDYFGDPVPADVAPTIGFAQRQ